MEPAVHAHRYHVPMTPEEISQFVEGLVRHVFEYLRYRDAPDAIYYASEFPFNIRNAVRELIQDSDCEYHNHWCEHVIEGCRSVPRQTFRELTNRIGHHLFNCTPPLDIDRPSTYIRLFALACKLCLKFYRARCRCGIQATKQSLKMILTDARTDRDFLLRLDDYAESVIHNLRSRRYDLYLSRNR